MGVEQQEDIFRWKNRSHQYCATIAANLVALAFGCTIGWTSPAVPVLISEKSPLFSGPLTNEQVSWIGSIDQISGLLGSLLFGFLSTKFGSRYGVMLLSVPIISFWLLILFGNKFYEIVLAKCIVGFTSGGSQSAIMLFISEISNDDIRGRLGSVMLVSRSVGTLVAYVVGASVQYQYVPCISGVIPIVFLVVFMMVPNTPQYYLRRGQNDNAEKVLKFYKGYKGNDQQEDNAIHLELEKMKMIANGQNAQAVGLSDFLNRDAMKGLGIALALVTFVQCTASYALVTYAVMTFAKLGTQMDPYVSSIMLALTLIVGALTSTYIADKLGRRKLNLISLLGCALGLFVTALYYFLNLNGFDLSAFAWAPVFCLCLVIYLSSAGIAPMAYLCSCEYFKSNIRAYGLGMTSFSSSCVTFISTKMYPILLASLDLHGCLAIYALGCLIGFIFVLCVLKETNGKCLNDEN